MMLDDLDDLYQWVEQLAGDYRLTFGPGPYPRDSALPRLIELAGQLVKSHEEVAEEYRYHTEVMTERLRWYETTTENRTDESGDER